MLNMPFILGFIGAAVGIIIGILIFSQVSAAIPCPGLNSTTGHYNTATQGYAQCQSAISISWTVLGILPVGLFFALFAIFGGLGGHE